MRALLLTLALALPLAGCQSAYYATMEKAGIHKRDILADRVESASESQQEAQEQFKSALEHFRAVVKVDGGELEARYDDLSTEFERSEAAAQDVRNRIDAVEDVAEALFEEWQGELNQYSSPSLKAASARSLRDTQSRYQRLIRAMRRAEIKMDPVLDKFRDQVLYLKHNLNARAIGALKGELSGIELQVNRLIGEMNASIAESEQFVASLEQQ